MCRRIIRVVASCGLLLTLVASFAGSNNSLEQKKKQPLVCKKSVLAALKPAPEFTYPCDEQLQPWDEKILQLPARVEALRALASELESFTDAAWWTADTVDLSVCDYAKKAGALTAEQRHDFTSSEYLFWLFGNDRIRLVLVSDPCYQTEYGGANAFLLYRGGDRVYATLALNGYFSRADNSVSLAFAKLRGQEVIEISTGSGGLNPSLTNYYFTIDSHSNYPVQMKLFRGEHGPTNEISSAMLFGPGPGVPEPLQIVRGQSLAPNFTVYLDDPKGKIDDNGRTFTRKVLRWNGKSYQ